MDIHIKSQITENEERILAAIKSSDIKVLDELIHEDLLFTLPNGQLLTKAMDMESHRSGMMQVDALTYSEQEIKILENTAVVSVIVEISGKFMTEPIHQKIRQLRIWKKISEKWMIIAGSSTLISN